MTVANLIVQNQKNNLELWDNVAVPISKFDQAKVILININLVGVVIKVENAGDLIDTKSGIIKGY